MPKSPSRGSAGKSTSSTSKKKAAASAAKSGKAAAAKSKSAKVAKASAPAKSKSAAKSAGSAKKGAKTVAPKKAASSSPGKAATKTAAAKSSKPAAKAADKKSKNAPAKAAGKTAAKSVAKPKAPEKKAATAKAPATASKGGKKTKAAATAVESKKAAATKQPKAAKVSKAAKSSGGRGRGGSKELANPRSVAAAAASRSEAGDSGGYMFINGRRVRMISTKGLSIPKRAKATPVEEVSPEAEAERIRAIKTKLSESDLTKYRELLLEKRRELVGVVNVMEEEALRSSGGNLSNMPLHMADVGSDTYDQDFTLGMAEAERRLLAEIDAAIGRIADRTYGVCQMTGKPIPKARLNAKPWAKYTIEAARLVEAGQAR